MLIGLPAARRAGRVALAMLAVMTMLAGSAGCSARRSDPAAGDHGRSGPCSPPGASLSGQADYADFVRFEGRRYLHDPATPGDDLLDAGLVGARIGQVDCRLANLRMPDRFQPRDGDAAYLPAGTALHEVHGCPRSFALAAASERGYLRYDYWPAGSQPSAAQANRCPVSRS